MKLWTQALDLVFPPKCPFCLKVLDEPRAPLCPACQTKLPWLMGERGRRPVDFTEGCLSPLGYRDSVRDAVQRFKFQRVQAYDRPFALLMAQCVRDHMTQLPQGVTWTPLSKKRLRERGFDQSERLARVVGELLSLPVLPTLEKCRHTRPQSELETEKERQDNARDAYRLLPQRDIQGKSLLLVDDVVTSGATLGACAHLLREGGAGPLWCLTLAQARRG